jgi:quinol monooxygenase YgiN
MRESLTIMSQLSKAVSIHPYFKINEGRVDDFKLLINDFIKSTSTEETCLYYDFSICGDVAFCREAYIDGDAVLAHLENVGAHIEASAAFSEMIKLEMHGPAEELDKLRGPLAELPVEYFVHVAGVQK